MNNLNKRIEQINKKYLPVIEQYDLYMDVLNNLSFDKAESLTMTTSKAYILTNDIKRTTDILNDLGYRSPSNYNSTGLRKLTRTDVIEVLRSINTNTVCKYEKLAKSQYKENRGHFK